MAIFSSIERRNYRAAVDNCAKFEATAKRILDKAESEGRELTEAEREDVERLMGKMAAAQGTLDSFRLRADSSLEAVIERENFEQQSSDAAMLRSFKSGETRGKVFASFGDQLAAIARSAQGITDERLQRVESLAAGMNEGIGSEGGWAIESTFIAEIQRRIYEQSVVAKLCRRFEVGKFSNSIILPAVDETSRADGQRLGGVVSYRIAEGGTFTPSMPKLRRLEVKLTKLGALAYVSNELLDDAPTMGRFMTDCLVEELAFRVDTEILRGNGGAEMIGVLNSPSLVTVSPESLQTADTINAQNVAKMWSRLWARSRRSAFWFVNPSAEHQLHLLTIGQMPVYTPPGGMSAAPYATLLGRPVLPVEQCSALGDAGDIILADMTQFVIAERGLNTASSLHVRFVTDESAFRAVWRINGQPAWSAALTPYLGSDTVSPFVVIGDRSE
jgi:HK97 family phage major capsid protein